MIWSVLYLTLGLMVLAAYIITLLRDGDEVYGAIDPDEIEWTVFVSALGVLVIAWPVFLLSLLIGGRRG